ncbi:putative Ig domain-containing protein [Roseicyclus amphidinii]|uniref:putative Ig domain-containing protein n=1 Tax=Roseicyclus amphidinii TaxID=3034232 RepID=UPI0024E13738|nr:putative Ig domain-containing protein [Roseicyclus sp. Amp-Y-6]
MDLGLGLGLTSLAVLQRPGGVTLPPPATAAGALGPFTFATGEAVSVDVSADFTTNGNTLTYTIAPALPAGLTLATNGILSGTPTTETAAASYTVTGQDEHGRETTSAFSLGVAATDGLQWGAGGNLEWGAGNALEWRA